MDGGAEEAPLRERLSELKCELQWLKQLRKLHGSVFKNCVFIYFQKFLFVIPQFTGSRHCHCQAGKPAREYNVTLAFTQRMTHTAADTTNQTHTQLSQSTTKSEGVCSAAWAEYCACNQCTCKQFTNTQFSTP
jgi:hypothetical protein